MKRVFVLTGMLPGYVGFVMRRPSRFAAGSRGATGGQLDFRVSLPDRPSEDGAGASGASALLSDVQAGDW